MKNGTPSAPLACWICRFALRPTDPVKRHATEIMHLGERKTIRPLAHVGCIARVESQNKLTGWNGPKDTGAI